MHSSLAHLAQVRFPDSASYVGVSSLLVLVPTRTVFLRGLRISSLPPSLKINISKFQFDQETAEEEPLCGYATVKIEKWCILLFVKIKLLVLC